MRLDKHQELRMLLEQKSKRYRFPIEVMGQAICSFIDLMIVLAIFKELSMDS